MDPLGTDNTNENIRRMMSRARMNLGSGIETQKKTYHRVIIDGDDGDKDFLAAAELIGTIILIRDRYKETDQGQEEETEDVIPEQTTLDLVDGIFTWSGMTTQIVSWKQYMQDTQKVFSAIENGPALTAARQRLNILEEKFELYSLLNTDLEETFDRARGGGGVYGKCTRVDNNIRLATCMNASTLVKFISDAGIRYSDTIVTSDSHGNAMTLGELMESSGVVNPENLTVEGLGLHPSMQRKRFHHFDVFNAKLNPGGKPMVEILKVFLRKETMNHGAFFGRIARDEMDKKERASQAVVVTESKIPILGHQLDEWAVLARWVKVNGLHMFRRNLFTVQIPRFQETRSSKNCETVADQLNNIFRPLFMATLFPRHPDYQDIAILLQRVGSFNVTSDESSRDMPFFSEPKPPQTIPWSENVNDFYFMYYIWANLCSLNALRKRRGLNTIKFVPTCGEIAPHLDQLVAAYLMADGIHHGFRLRSSWILQYLYMFHRIPIAMSPLSNNALYVPFFDNPFPTYFKRGLNVSLATDNPLHFHHSTEPLIEEYATAMKIYQLTATDLSEIAYNSVIASAFPHAQKCEWLGPSYLLLDGNDITKSNLCDFRLQFRHECLLHEQSVLNLMLSQAMKKKEPIVIGKVKAMRRHNLNDTLPQLRGNIRRMNYVDRRIVYPRIELFGGITENRGVYEKAAQLIRKAVSMREKYTRKYAQDVHVEDVFQPHNNLDESVLEYNHYYGVYLLSKIGTPPPWPQFIPPIRQFIEDVNSIRHVVNDSDVISLARHRLQLLEHKFVLHLAMNISKESGKLEEKEHNNRDFFTARKVDNNINADAGMNVRSLLDFFMEKATHHSHDVVFERDSVPVTLRELLDEVGINPERLTCDELQSFMTTNVALKDLFLSSTNFMGGRYFAELLKWQLELYKLDAYTFSENRLEITGGSRNEWHELAQWFDKYGMASAQNRWMIRIPRAYRRLKQGGKIRNFGQLIDNLFQPLWEVSLHPADNSKFHYFLSHVSGFDCVDDETKVDLPLDETFPHDWRSDRNPGYNYYMYYIWANIVSLNEFRASRGLSTFSFRPQSGERGGVEHLIGAYLIANSINHGVTLANYPALEYIFFATQLQIAMSPLSNTSGSSAYLENPFPTFFRRGLCVALSTHTPLFFHFTTEPLIEEYSIAAKIWKHEMNDQAEIARNSVLMCGFPGWWKQETLGELYTLHSTLGNDVRRTRVSDIRVAYRYEVYHTEMNFLDSLLIPEDRSSADPVLPNTLIKRAMMTIEDEVTEYERVTGTKLQLDHDSDEDGDEIGPPDPEKKASQLRHQLEELSQKMLRTQMAIHETKGENANMAHNIKRLRSRINEDSLHVVANLGNSPGGKKAEGEATPQQAAGGSTPAQGEPAPAAGQDKAK